MGRCSVKKVNDQINKIDLMMNYTVNSNQIYQRQYKSPRNDLISVVDKPTISQQIREKLIVSPRKQSLDKLLNTPI
jgi:hypothetical protein